MIIFARTFKKEIVQNFCKKKKQQQLITKCQTGNSASDTHELSIIMIGQVKSRPKKGGGGKKYTAKPTINVPSRLLCIYPIRNWVNIHDNMILHFGVRAVSNKKYRYQNTDHVQRNRLFAISQ